MAQPSPAVVHVWPGSVPQAVADLRSARAVTVISVATPETTIRQAARTQIRIAVLDTLAALLGCPPASITLISQPGQPIIVDGPDAGIGLSVSHAAGLSVAAIHRGASIGVDVMRHEPGADTLPDWEMLVRDYLGPQAWRRLGNVAPQLRASAFAQEWTAWEARLKCLGLALTEWTPILEQRLVSCRVMALALPDKYCGAMATR